MPKAPKSGTKNDGTACRRPRVLVVEDDQELVRMVQHKFNKEQFDLRTAANGSEGLAAARAQKPELILLDLVMPVMDGFETLRELKADPALKDVPVLVLTNLSHPEDMKRCEALGAGGFLVKPEVSLSSVAARIREMLAGPVAGRLCPADQ